MFERFTVPARETVVRARAEAIAMRHGFIGTEHLLLALLDERTGRAAEVLRAAGVTAPGVRAAIHRHTDPSAVLGESDADALRAIGIDLDAVRDAVEQTFGEGALRPSLPGRKGLFGKGSPVSRLTKRGRKVLELALRESIHARSREITPEHILLGIIREEQGLAALILTKSGVDLAALRRRLLPGDQAA